MSNTSPSPVVTEVETILSDIAPVIPRLAQKIPAKIRGALYIGIPISVTVFDSVAPSLHIGSTVVAVTNAVALFVESFVAVGNTPKA